MIDDYLDVGGRPLMDRLVPYHMLYADGVERLAAEGLLERQRWLNKLWLVFSFFLPSLFVREGMLILLCYVQRGCQQASGSA